MRLTVVGKFPPIEGGVAARTYWLMRSIAERGVEVSIVTNAALVEERYREVIGFSKEESQDAFDPHTKIFSIEGLPPHHIPNSQGYATRLANLALKVIGEEGSNLIFTNYLEPYAVAGFLLKHLTGLPLAVQHAGSDLYTILPHKEYALLLGRILTQADSVVTSKSSAPFLERLGARVALRPPFAIDTRHFSPNGLRFDLAQHGVNVDSSIPLIAYIGKLGSRKGVRELLKALALVRKDFRLLLVSSDDSEALLQPIRSEHPALAAKILQIPFIAPWQVPALLRSISVLAHLEHKFPVPVHFPQQPFEAIATGTPLLLSEEVRRKIRPILGDVTDMITTAMDPRNTPALADTVDAMLENLPRAQAHAAIAYTAFLKVNDWNAYVEGYLSIFRRLSSPWRRRLPRLF